MSWDFDVIQAVKFKCYLYTGKSSAFGNSYILLSMCYVEIDCILILTLILFFVFFLFCFVLVCFICLSVEFA